MLAQTLPLGITSRVCVVRTACNSSAILLLLARPAHGPHLMTTIPHMSSRTSSNERLLPITDVVSANTSLSKRSFIKITSQSSTAPHGPGQDCNTRTVIAVHHHMMNISFDPCMINQDLDGQARIQHVINPIASKRFCIFKPSHSSHIIVSRRISQECKTHRCGTFPGNQVFSSVVNFKIPIFFPLCILLLCAVVMISVGG